MVKTKVSSKGVVTTPGSGYEVTEATTFGIAAHNGMLPYPKSAIALTADTTLNGTTQYGVITISGTSAVTVTMAAAATAVGSMTCFRSLGNTTVQHILTASATDAGVFAFSSVFPDQNGTGHASGSSLTLDGETGASVALMCDGRNYLVMAGSGTFAIAGT